MKKRTTIGGLVISLAAVGGVFGFSNASAYTYAGSMTEQDTTDILANQGSDMFAMDLAVSCSEINSVIANSRYRTNLFLKENCNTNINIPSGKRIAIFTEYYNSASIGSYGSMSSINTSSNILSRHTPRSTNDTLVSHSLTGSITVAQGSTVTLGGGNYNASGSSSVIVNNGTLFLAATVQGNISNAGKLTIGGGDYTNATFSNNGNLSATDGIFANNEIAQQYAVDGCRITSNIVTQPAYMWEYYSDVKIPAAIDVDVPYTINSNTIKYPTIAEANMVMPRSSAPTVLKVTGSPTTGITLTGLKSKEGVGMIFTNDLYTSSVGPNFGSGEFSKYYKDILTYELADKTISSAMRKYINDLFNEAYDNNEEAFVWEALRSLVNQNGKVIVSKLQERLGVSNVAPETVEKVNSYASKNGSTVTDYYDISMQLINSVDSSKIKDLSDLNGVEQSFSLDTPKDLPEVKDGYTRTYQVYRVHNGEVAELPNEVVDGKVVFATDKFSTYALGYKDEKAVKVPDTGDSTNPGKDGALAIFTVSTGAVLTMLGLMIYLKNRKKDHYKFD